MSLTSLLESITRRRQQQRRLTRWSEYKQLVADICDGKEPDADQIAALLADNERTLDDLRGDVELLARRRKMRAEMDAIVQLEKEAMHSEIYSRCNPELGDVLLIKDGATTGIACINQLAEPFSMLSSVALLKHTDAISNRYLLWAIRSPFFYGETRRAMKGAAINRVTLRVLSASLTPLPLLAEQKRIAGKVDELMGLCDRLEALEAGRKERHASLSRAALARFADSPTPTNLQSLFHNSYEIVPAEFKKAILRLTVRAKLTLNNPRELACINTDPEKSRD